MGDDASMQLAILRAKLAQEPHETWMTLPHVAKLLGTVESDLERALDGDPLYGEGTKVADRDTLLEARVDPSFTWEGGSNFDERGLTRRDMARDAAVDAADGAADDAAGGDRFGVDTE